MNAPKTRIVLHIGVHKTGTSAIQSYLHSHSSTLAQQGILYPESGRHKMSGGFHISHHLLAWSVVGRYATKYNKALSREPWDALRQEVETTTADVAVVSSEFFWPATTEEIARIREYLSEYPVQVILYVRNPLDLAVSSYKQGVKTGKVIQDFSTHCRERLWRYDFDAIITRWREIFGSSNVTFRLYDEVKNSLLSDFAQAARFGISLHKQYHEKANVSPADGTIYFILLLNRIEARLPRNMRLVIHRIRRSIIKGRQPGKALAYIANSLYRKSIAEEKNVDWIQMSTTEMCNRFMQNHIAPEDHRFSDFNMWREGTGHRP